MKKSLLAIGAFMMPAMAFSVNYFQAGTQWTIKVGSLPDEMKTIVYTLEEGPVAETDEAGALRLFSRNEAGEEKLEALILAEGERVLFWENEAGWQLLYDFSLQVGDEAVLFSGMYDSPDYSWMYPESVTAKCNKIVDSYASIPFADGVFFLETYTDNTETPYSYAVWLNGIGSVQGPLTNFETDMDGELRSLDRVISGGEVIYDSNGSLGVSTVASEEEAASALYRLDGIPDNRRPGIVISKGKKVIRH